MRFASSASRSSWPWLLGATLLLSCGARDALEVPEDGGGAGDRASGGGGTGGAGAAGGAGGGEDTCAQLSWAGDPVFVTVPFGSVAKPKLVAVSPTDWALTFEASDAAGGLVASVRVSDPFATWPPAVGMVDANFPTNQPFAVASGDPGRFAFTLGQPGSPERVLAQAEPGQNGSTLVTYFRDDAAALSLARDELGRYAVARGGQPGGLEVDVVDSFAPDAFVSSTGILGCSDPPPSAALVPAPAGGFLVASTADQPFDSCIDPDLPGPPTAVQLHHLSFEGAAQGSAFSEVAPIRSLHLAPRPDGAWLLFARDDAHRVEVHPVEETGLIEWEPWTFSDTWTDARHDLAPFLDGFVVATNAGGPGDLPRSIDLLARPDFFGGESLVGASSLTFLIEVGPETEPTLGTLAGVGSVLLAFIDGTAEVPTLVLLRADCAPAWER